MQPPGPSATDEAAPSSAFLLDTRCPSCRVQGDATGAAEVFECVTGSCRVWTYEAGRQKKPEWPPHAELMRRRGRPPC